jgi:PTS system nitrogen regulatory IIA component
MKLLKVKELCDWLDVTDIWVYQKAQKGEIPALKIGRYWRFDAEEIREWLRTQAREKRA